MKSNKYVVLIALVAALGGLLFGFDTAVISGTTPFLQVYFSLSDIALGWTVSILIVGCIFGVIISGKPSDLYGRRNTLMFAAGLFILSAIGSALATDWYFFMLSRFVGGLAVGIASMLSPMYISEISPSAIRGRMVSLNQLAIVTGILIAFFSNYFLANVGDNNWRWMLAVMSIPAILFFIFLFFVPESPRWLVQKNNSEGALNVLTKISGIDIAKTELKEIEYSIHSNVQGTYKELLSKNIRPILWIGILLAIFQQATGINAIMYYAPIIFKKIGSQTDSALIQTAAVGGINFIFTIVAIKWIDNVGRKPLLVGGTIGMLVSLLVISIAFFMNAFDNYIILIFILLFIASFAASAGPIAWVVISEIFPNKLRSKAMSVAIVVLWIACFVVSLTFPVMLNGLGGAFTFLVFGIMCLLMLIFVLVKLPETKGKSLEELEKILLK